MPPSPFQPEPVPAPHGRVGEAPRDGGRPVAEARPAWAVVRVGYLVPREDFDGTVHAVFERACYIERGDELLTLVAGTLHEGPTTLRLDRATATDLRHAFRRGDAMRCRNGRASSRGAVLDLRGATTWHAPPRPAPLAPRDRLARLELARARLAWAQHPRSSVLAREGVPAIASLEAVCLDLDLAAALGHAQRFVGWGEGLTPAGDDFLVGLAAALGALADDPGRVAFARGLREYLGAQFARTTPIAAHCLKLAAHGHFNAGVLLAVEALRAEPGLPEAQAALDALLSVGATSGADVLTGIVCGFAAWSGAAHPQCPRIPSTPARPPQEMPA
jgi:hypothetical protein